MEISRSQFAVAFVTYVIGIAAGMFVALFVLLDAFPAHAAESATKWSGCYAGAGGQYSMVDTKAALAEKGVGDVIGVDGAGMQGWGLYGKVGCDVELLPRVVVGAWGDYAWHNSTDFAVSVMGAGDIAKTNLKTDWAVGGRAGYIVHPDALAYLLVGYTQAKMGDISSPAGAFTSLSVPTFSGYVVGGGIDLALGRGWFTEAEYRWSHYGRQDIDLCSGCGVTLGLEPDVQTFRVGLAYKFGMDGFNAPPMK